MELDEYLAGFPSLNIHRFELSNIDQIIDLALSHLRTEQLVPQKVSQLLKDADALIYLLEEEALTLNGASGEQLKKLLAPRKDILRNLMTLFPAE